MKNNISLILGLKNNLEYTKHFYKTTRQIYPEIEICFSSYNSTDGTNEWLESLKNDPYTKTFYSQDKGNFSDNFNKAVSLSTKEYIAFLHNDIVISPKFIENLEKHINKNTVVSYTTIEPPVFAGHERPGKIIYDLGIDLDLFDIDKLYKISKIKQIEFENKIEDGITFFMCMPKNKYLEMGGLDNRFDPMFCEDDDLILRWKLLGLKCITSLDAICYHFVSKTSRFSDEYQHRTQQIEQQSNINFIKKWGFRNSQHNVVYKKSYKLINSNIQLEQVLEPWFNGGQDIIVEIDGNNFTQQDYQYIQQLNDIIKDNNDTGVFQIGNLKVTINNLNEYQNELIYIKN